MMDELDLYWMWTTLDCLRGEVICDICITLLVMGIFTSPTVNWNILAQFSLTGE